MSATWVDIDTGDALADATSGNDAYTGTAGDDIADGLDGNDTLTGLKGNDALSGSGGDDSLFGGLGDDQLYGGAGADQLLGSQGKDTLDGGAGDDTFDGGVGADILISGGGNDVMDGGIGNDTFRFDGAQDGDVVTAIGDTGGQDTIDLSGYNNNQLTDNGSQITVDMGGGQSFTVNYTDMDEIVTAEGTYAPGSVPTNAAADAFDDVVVTTEGQGVTTGNVLANDTDPDGDTLSVQSFTQASNGTVVDNGDGTFTYTPNGGFSGSDSFTYTVDDGNGNTDTATVNVTVNAAPPPPNEARMPSMTWWSPRQGRMPPPATCWPTTPTSKAIR